MSQYRCEYTRHGDVSAVVMIEADNDSVALIAADDRLTDHPVYLTVEIFEGDRRVARLERTTKEPMH